MYRVLYRKWRPKTFNDVAGQEHITTTLKNEIKSDRINHAYLFTGSRGTGKTTCAKILSKAVNCLNIQDGNPCCECENCLAIENNSILDVIEMDGASNRRIDDIREVIEESQFTPAKLKYRVYIIDEVHMLTMEAFNALLKTLEEPPKHVVFILATTEVRKIPLTILSRCQRFDFHRIKSSEIIKRLQYVAEQENIQITEESLTLISAIADGALRDALSLFDRCIGLSSNVDIETVTKTAGLAKRDYLFKLAACYINKDTEQALEIIDELYKESKDMTRLCDELSLHFRNLMLMKTVKKPRELLIVADSEFNLLQESATKLKLTEIVYAIDTLQSAYEKISKGVNSRIELEMCIVKLCTKEQPQNNDVILSRIFALEQALSQIMSNKIPVVSKSKAPTQPDPPEQIATIPIASHKNAIKFDKWTQVVAELKKYSHAISAAFESTNAYIEGNYILIESETDIPFKLLRQSAQRDKIKLVIQEITGKKYSLGPYNKPKEIVNNNSIDPLSELIADMQGNGVDINIIED